jgi:hypothetical protein
MKIKSGSSDPDPDLFFVNTGPGVQEKVNISYKRLNLYVNIHHNAEIVRLIRTPT